MTIRRTSWLALAVAAAAATGISLSMAGCADSPGVLVARVARGAIATRISTNGQVQPIAPHILTARLDTFVSRVAVASGQAVRKGQLLVQLDASAAEAQLAAARQNLLAANRLLRDAQAGGPPDDLAQLQSQLTKAQAQRDRLAAEHKTLVSLVAQHAATEDELAQNDLQLKQADADLRYALEKQQDLARQAHDNAAKARLEIEQAQAQIRNLGEQVADARLVSPIDGTVYALGGKLSNSLRAGDYVHAGDSIVSVADLTRVRILAYVDEVYVGMVGLNQPVEVRWDGLPGRTWQGVTERLPKQVVPYGDRRVGEVFCSVENSDGRLLPNTNVDLDIRVAQRADALQVPREAVQVGQDGRHFVFLVQGGRLHRQPVDVGIASTTSFQIVSGVEEGDWVALPGAVALKDGMKIRPREGK